MQITYSIYVDFRNDGSHLSMAQCHECDELCSGLIEQVLGNLIDWHGIETINDLETAHKWAIENLSEISDIQFAIMFECDCMERSIECSSITEIKETVDQIKEMHPNLRGKFNI